MGWCTVKFDSAQEAVESCCAIEFGCDVFTGLNRLPLSYMGGDASSDSFNVLEMEKWEIIASVYPPRLASISTAFAFRGHV